jgi:hypothetical protein
MSRYDPGGMMAMEADSLYNNPWYWSHAGSLSSQLGTGTLQGSQGDQGYFDPYFASQWSSSPVQMQLGADLGALAASSNQLHAYLQSGEQPARTQHTGEAGEILGYQPARWHVRNAGRLAHATRAGTAPSELSDGAYRVGIGRIGEESLAIYAAPQRGLTARRPFSSARTFGLTAMDEIHLKNDLKAGRTTGTLGVPYDGRFSTAVQSLEVPTPLRSANLGEMSRIQQEILGRYASEAPDETSDVDVAEALDTQLGLMGRLMAGLERYDALVEEDRLAQDAQTPAPERPTIDRARLANALQHGLRIEDLAGPDQDRFQELMRRGEAAMGQGEFFLAEQFFERSLRMIPGHPMATVGKAHAELGAGFYLTASINLQGLLAFQPEMIDVLYGPSALPADLDLAITELRTRLLLRDHRDHYGFLLAYIGHQQGDQAQVEEGLDVMSKGVDDTTFLQLLESIWEGSRAP